MGEELKLVWVLAQRARLRDLALQALHTLAVHHTRSGADGHPAGIEVTTRLLTLEPWREQAHLKVRRTCSTDGEP